MIRCNRRVNFVPSDALVAQSVSKHIIKGIQHANCTTLEREHYVIAK